MADKFGKAEVQDTLGDVVEAVGPNGIRSAFQGKFELVKFLIEAAEVYPTIREAIDDFPVFWQEFKDLTPQESLEVVAGIKARHPEPDEVQKTVINVLENAALTQDYIQNKVIGGGAKLVEQWKNV